MRSFHRLESEVRSYCRAFPTVFARASGSVLVAEDGREYVDFFSGAGALAYGHGEPRLKQALLTYLAGDGIVHSLDMATTAKRAFLERFEQVILRPRGLRYKLMFPGPTGTNAVEAALKLARKVTGRTTVVSFTNGFHGMTLGSLAMTGNRAKRAGAGVPLGHGAVAPFDGYLGADVDTLDVLERMLEDRSSGLDQPAAFLVETVQGEGGVHVASTRWLRGLADLARRHGALLIVDDVQAGCGRTGRFFSFERASVTPDLVCLSKALSGFGLPMALVLIRPELDAWAPGEHNGTFRGHMPAFVTATAALDVYWQDDALATKVDGDGAYVAARLDELSDGEVRGVGLLRGLAFDDPGVAARVARDAFSRGLVIERSGPLGEVVKVMPPLVIDRPTLDRGLALLARSVDAALRGSAPRNTAAEVTA